MNLTEIIYKRLLIIEPKYKKYSIDDLNSIIKKGEGLIKKHGVEHLPFKLGADVDALWSAGAFFNYQVASNERNYKPWVNLISIYKN